MRTGMRWVIFVVGWLAAVGVVGCGRQVHRTEGDFTKCGIPERQFLVGGGFEVRYVAPADGTVFWVEERTRRIVVTRTVQKGEEVRLGERPAWRDLEDTLGMYVRRMKLSLYFVPSGVECAAR
ncbi:MAG TPA: hypothetical protein P5279_01555 [Anaerohalosphaeraceae bacterium]|jgi:hypothetical protein|nr:hypothetical protein [Anaerohalosphaeraceae bacterium]HRT49154.1 hypothetical protein [Anaerohalosphaeraceae bacterium]HRT87787.1 hypothetical protein [Anaerohalosphaeraceae bacterium]